MATKKFYSATAAFLLLSCLTTSAENRSGFVTLDSGLQYKIVKEANDPSSPRPRQGDTVKAHYTGWLEDNHEKFDSSYDRNQPFSFMLGRGNIIKGWEEGLRLMRVGEKRTFIVPPHLGYGVNGQGRIPKDATLIFDIELLEIN